MWLWIILLVLVALAAYVRLAPSDPARWHQPIDGTIDRVGSGHALRVLPSEPGLLARLDAIMAAQSATTRLAGSVAEARITYVSRSKWFGFPDYTTIEEADGQIRMLARQRFGQSDFGVNAARLERLIASAKAG